MINNMTVAERLSFESYRRGANGAIPQIILMFVLCLTLDPIESRGLYLSLAGLLIGIQIFRAFIFRKYKNDPKTLLTRFPGTLYLGVVTGMVWSMQACLVNTEAQLSTSTAFIHLLVINALMAANMYSMASVPNLQRMYILIMGLPTALTLYILEKGAELQYVYIPVVLYTLYLTQASKNHSLDLSMAYDFENKLVDQNKKLQAVLDSVPGFVVLLSPKGEWIQGSAGAGPFRNSAELHDEIAEFMTSNLVNKTKECELKIFSQTETFVVTFEKLTSSTGGCIVLGIPITELVQVRKDLEKQKAIADYSAKLAALGEVAGGVAHEINNPLAIMNMLTTVLVEKIKKMGDPGKDLLVYPSRIKDMIDRASGIVKSLQSLTHEKQVEPSAQIDINEVIQNALTVCRNKAQKQNVQIEFESESQQVQVYGPQVQIGQVFLNLLSNSFDALKNTENKSIKVKVVEYPEKVEVLIQDTGVGIPDAVLGKLFQPFLTMKPIGEGAGLGLSVSRSIMQKCGGDLVLEKSQNPTTFVLIFRRDAQSAQSKSAA